MDSKFYILAVACLIAGLAGGYLLGSNSTQSQLAVVNAQIQNTKTALSASEAQVLAMSAEIQAKDALIQSQLDQLKAQKDLIDADAAVIQAKDNQIATLTQLIMLLQIG
jgi:peptidoglycan hydrolase CwlO-like protein